jgi:hypothetical protein
MRKSKKSATTKPRRGTTGPTSRVNVSTTKRRRLPPVRRTPVRPRGPATS